MSGARLLSWIALALTVLCTVLVGAADSSAHAAHLVIAWTGGTSVVLFLLAYIARPLTQLRPARIPRRLLAQRKWLGLGFATSHAFHLAGIVTLAWPAPGVFVRSLHPTIVVAVAVYLLLFAMTITSIERVKKAIPRRAWKHLHRAGMHGAWIAFAFTYAGAVLDAPVFVIPLLLLLGAAGLRYGAWQRGKHKRVNIG